MTYKEVAILAGSPMAYRAAGNALNKNPHPYPLCKPGRNFYRKADYENLVPCHRVIKSNGGIGGYRGGVERKIFLLQKEGLKIIKGEIKIEK